MPAALDLPRLPLLAQDVLVRLHFPRLRRSSTSSLRFSCVADGSAGSLAFGSVSVIAFSAAAALTRNSASYAYLRGRSRASAVARTLRTFDETCSTVSTSMKSTR